MPMNPYYVLGVRPDATPEEIKLAYKTRAKQLHPDAGGSEDEFQTLNQANEILTDPQRRARFDQHGDTTEPEKHDPDAQAWAIIAYLVGALSVMQQDNTDDDVIDGMRNGIDHAVGQLHKREAAAREAKRRLEKMLSKLRFRSKKGTTDRMVALINYRLRAAETEMERIRAEIPHHERARVLLNGYSYDHHTHLMRQFSNSTAATSTWTTGY